MDRRLDRLTTALTARERAVLVLRSWKEGKAEELLWRATMPPAQSTEFNRLIDLMNGTMVRLSLFITTLRSSVEKLELRQAWLVTLKLWEEQLMEIRRAVRLGLKEPVTESDYARKVAEAEAEWVAVGELAELLADDYDGWQEDDFEELEGWDSPVVSDTAWQRAKQAKEKEPRQRVQAGELVGRGKGSRLKIREREFNQLHDRTEVAFPEYLYAYRVLPDDESAEIELEKRWLDDLLMALDSRPLTLKDVPDEVNVLDHLSGILRKSLASSFEALWQEVRAVELVLEEVAREFEGTDPVRPAKREELDQLRAKLAALAEQLLFLEVAVEMTEPDEETLELVRGIVFRE
jgi:hypothetical protein